MTEWKFKPKPDITTHELAQLFVELGVTVYDAAVEQWPESVSRHFERVTPTVN